MALSTSASTARRRLDVTPSTTIGARSAESGHVSATPASAAYGSRERATSSATATRFTASVAARRLLQLRRQQQV